MAILIGILIGSVLGLTGAGGSIFAVPLLILLLGETPNSAIGLSLAAVFLSAMMGVALHWRNNSILWVPALVFAAGGFIAAPVGRYLAGFVADPIILYAFSVVALYVAIRMWRQATRDPEATTVVRAGGSPQSEMSSMACRFSPTGKFQLRLPCMLMLVGAGLFAGTFSGFFGVGGGFIIVPLLVAISGLPMLIAVGTSLVIISVTALSGFVGHWLLEGTVDWQVIGLLSLGGVIGMFVGHYTASFIAGPKLNRVFSIMVVLVTLLTLFRSHV